MPKGCASLSQITIDLCQGSVGGVRALYLAEYKENPITVGKDSGNTNIEVVTAIDSGITWTEIPVRKNSSSMTTEATVSDENGVYFSTTVNITLQRMDAAKRMLFNSIALLDCMAVVVDSNGQRWFVGAENPCVITSGTGQTGQARTDANNYTIAIQDDSTVAPYTLSNEVVIKTAGE